MIRRSGRSRSVRSKRGMAVGVLAALVLLTASVSTGAASASVVYGQITCVANPPMGVWLTTSSGGSGWASWGRAYANTINYSKSLPNGGSWYLAVGCGGSPASWGKTAYTDSYWGGGNYNFTCYDIRNAWYQYLRCQRT